MAQPADQCRACALLSPQIRNRMASPLKLLFKPVSCLLIVKHHQGQSLKLLFKPVSCLLIVKHHHGHGYTAVGVVVR